MEPEMDELTKITEVLRLTDSDEDKHFRILGGESVITDITKLTLPKPVPCALKILPCSRGEIVMPMDLLRMLPLPNQSGPLLSAKMTSLCRLTNGDAKVVYSATIVLEDGHYLQYDAGDSVGLLCANEDKDVDWLISRIDFGEVEHADRPFYVQSVSDKGKSAAPWLLPGIPVTARFLLTYCCQLHIPVTRRITRILAERCKVDLKQESIHFPPPQQQSSRLLEFSSREGTELFDKYIRGPNVTFMDLLSSFPACRIPLNQLLEILPRLQPRAYTIINRPDVNGSVPQSLCIVFTRVDISAASNAELPGLRRYSNQKHGVCTGWLERLWYARQRETDSASLLGIYKRKNLNSFQYPINGRRPIIMLGAGTGIAPFLSFLEEEYRRRAEDASAARDLWLIYGCRSPTTSLLFANRLAQALVDGILSRLCLCFSRHAIPFDEPKLPVSNSEFRTLSTRSCLHHEPCYVQHCILPSDSSTRSLGKHEQELAYWVLERNALVMVCGEARGMAPSVRKAWADLIDLVKARGNNVYIAKIGDFDGQTYVKHMFTEHRYLEDIWT